MTCLLLLTQIPEAYGYFQKQTAGFFLPLSMLGPWIIFYWMEKLINTVPSHCSKLHSPVFLPMLDFKIKIEIQMCFFIARDKEQLWECQNTWNKNNNKSFKASINLLAPAIFQVAFTWKPRHCIQNEDDDFTGVCYPHSALFKIL